MGKDPAMPFYVNDWLSSPQVQAMTPRQELAYFRLLLFSWSSQTASIPNDDDTLMALGRLDNKQDLTVVKRAFNETPNDAASLSNERLFDVWQERQQWRQQRVDAGVKSGQARKLRKSNERPTSVQRDGNSSSSSSSSSIKKNTPYKSPKGDTHNPLFEAFYDASPKRVAKTQAWTAWARALPRFAKETDTTQEEAAKVLISTMKLYAASAEGKGQFRVRPSRWLNEGRYNDDPAEWDRENDGKPTSPKPTRISG